MTYQCIRCEKRWITDNQSTEFISHGFCFKCFKKTMSENIRSRQLQEGNFDCFGRSNGHCDQKDCKYYQLCVYNKVGNIDYSKEAKEEELLC